MGFGLSPVRGFYCQAQRLANVFTEYLRRNGVNCVMGLRPGNNTAALKRMQKVWQVFELPKQATWPRRWGGGVARARPPEGFERLHYRMRSAGSVSKSMGCEGFVRLGRGV